MARASSDPNKIAGRILVSFPRASKVPGHLQSTWELNHRPRAQLLWKMTFQPLNHHLKSCFSKDTCSVILHFLTVNVLRLKFLFLYNTVPASPCCSPDTIKPACGAGAPLGQPWNGFFVHHACVQWVTKLLLFSFISIHFHLFRDAKLALKLKVDKTAQTNGFLQFSRYWFTSDFCKKWHEILLISKVISGLVTCES